jgi:hypothetical protein
MTQVSNNIAAFTEANLPSPIPVSDLSLATLLQYCNDKLTEYPLPIDSDGNWYEYDHLRHTPVCVPTPYFLKWLHQSDRQIVWQAYNGDEENNITYIPHIEHENRQFIRCFDIAVQELWVALGITCVVVAHPPLVELPIPSWVEASPDYYNELVSCGDFADVQHVATVKFIEELIPFLTKDAKLALVKKLSQKK